MLCETKYLLKSVMFMFICNFYVRSCVLYFPPIFSPFMTVPYSYVFSCYFLHLSFNYSSAVNMFMELAIFLNCILFLSNVFQRVHE
jgi:hypothetical protein